MSSRDRSATTARTRRAILDAAVEVLGRRQAASVAEVAEAAGMARSTVHRYFPERADLMAALERYAEEALREAAERARPGEGTGAEALLRICQHYFERADLVMVAYGNLSAVDELEGLGETDGHLEAIVRRGHGDGSIDPGLSGIWVEQLLWSMLYAAWLMAVAGKMSRHEALSGFLEVFGRVLAPARG